MERVVDIFNRKSGSSLNEVVSTQSICTMLQKNWDKIFGKLGEHLTYSLYRKGVLTIHCDNPMWVSEIDFYKDELIEKMNQLFSKKIVTILKVSYVKKEKKSVPVVSTEKETLETLIKKANKKRREEGKSLCSKCGKMFTSGSCCIYCSTNPMIV